MNSDLKQRLHNKIKQKKHTRRHKSNGKTIEDMQTQIDQLKFENNMLKKAIDPNMINLFKQMQKK